ncbi:hypothetical protein GCM10020254_11540 [Streptomyces goshikiensis]
MKTSVPFLSTVARKWSCVEECTRASSRSRSRNRRASAPASGDAQLVEVDEGAEEVALEPDVPAGGVDEGDGVRAALVGQGQVTDELRGEIGLGEPIPGVEGVEEVVTHPGGDEAPIPYR